MADTAQDEQSDHWFKAVRRFIRCSRTLNMFYRGFVGLIGTSVVIVGIVLIPLPGPGWLIVFAGLAVLATEFAWAGRVLRFARHQVSKWTHWAARQSLLVRAVIGVLGLLVVAAVVWLFLEIYGLPQ